jgi:diguanylate cyclase (GGDEF)-like protein/PAS domain S-box-containing protein
VVSTLSVIGGMAGAVGASAAFARRGHRQEGRARLCSFLLVVAAVVWCAAGGLRLAGGGAVGSPFAVASLAVLVPAGWGMALFPGAPRHPSGRARTLVDGLIVGTSLLQIAWVTGLGGLAAARPGAPLMLAQAVGYIALAGAVVVILTRARPTPRGALAWAAVGFCALAGAACGAAYLSLASTSQVAGALEAGWLIGWLALMVAASRSTMEEEDDVLEPGLPTRASVLVPSVPFAAATIAVAAALVDEELHGFLAWNAGAIVVLIVLRQILALLENISFWHRLESQVEARTDELGRSEARFRSLVQNSSEVITVFAPDGRIAYQSPAIRSMLGHEPHEPGCFPQLDLIHPDDLSRVSSFAAEVAATRPDGATIECRVSNAEGGWRHVEASISDLTDDPAVAGFVVHARDVSERKERELLAHRALHDPLTGVANRHLFSERLEHVLSQEPHAPDTRAVLFIDLDDFKYVNDWLGHARGDIVLRAVADRLVQCVRSADTVARFGGDEFAVLLGDITGAGEAVEISERILACLRDPIAVVDTRVRVRASIGIALLSGRAEDQGEVLSNADVAMYAAKARGQGRYQLFEPGMRATSSGRTPADGVSALPPDLRVGQRPAAPGAPERERRVTAPPRPLN